MKRKIIPYEKASLQDLDANVGISLGKGWDEQERVYAVPGFLIIGGQKCGTTALKTWLSIHPNLQTMPLESHFFDEVTHLEKDWSRYVINPYFYLRDPEHIHHTFEKTPDYFDKKNSQGQSAASLIKQMMPSGKFILLLRNPTMRAHSIYKMRVKQQAAPLQYSRIADRHLQRLEKGLSLRDYVPKGAKKLKTFTETVEGILQAVTTGKGIENYTREQLRMLTVGHYAEHLQHWLQHFDKEQILILFAEDFRSQPFDMMDKVLNFLDVPHIDYRMVTEQRERFWELIGYKKPSKEKLPFQAIKTDWVKPYLQDMDTTTKALLDDYFKSWNQKLAAMLPQHDIPWL